MAQNVKQAMREFRAARADIAPIPDPCMAAEREACRLDLEKFLLTFLPESFPLPFSPDHLRVIAKLQHAALKGGQFLEAVYRGFGKTTIAESCALWCLCYGHRRFVVIVGADQSAANKNASSIKTELECNDRLYAAFPEICHGVRMLEGISQRCASQTCNGEPTGIEWRADTVVLPFVANSPAAGSIVVCRGITGRINGLKHKRRDGSQLRPDFVLIDDPQTMESARSPLQVQARMDIVKRSIMKLAGHSKKISVVMAATVMECDDLVDQLLDRNKNANWVSERIPMVTAWAKKHDDLWMGEYARLRRAYSPDLPGDQTRAHGEATEFYRARREEMDEGAVVSWEHCFDETEISAVQHAYNALIDDGDAVFQAEFQGKPLSVERHSGLPTLDKIISRMLPVPRGVVPMFAQTLTAQIDVHDDLLFWAVCAWGEKFTGHVVDYGVWPEQKSLSFQRRNVRNTLQRASGANTRDGALAWGIAELAKFLSRDWKREDGQDMRVARGGIDEGYAPEVIYNFCRRQQVRLFIPTKGVAVRAAQQSFIELPPKPGERRGNNVRELVNEGAKFYHLLIDVNYWKGFVLDRFSGAPGDVGKITLYQAPDGAHYPIGEHLTAETFVPVSARGRTVREWSQLPGRTENHWLDCVVGCAASASMVGIMPEGVEKITVRRAPVGGVRIERKSNAGGIRTRY